MKKLISVILAAMMVVLLAACGGGSKGGATQYVFLKEEMGTESYAIGFKKGNEELAKTVTGAVYALVKDGTYAKIGEKYPDIKDYLSLKAEDINDADIPAKGSGDPNFTFKHGFDLDYPPYSYLKDDGSVGGFDVELCQAVCEYMGWKYESVPFNWEAKDMELNAGSCDCIWSGFTKEGREDKLLEQRPGHPGRFRLRHHHPRRPRRQDRRCPDRHLCRRDARGLQERTRGHLRRAQDL